MAMTPDDELLRAIEGMEIHADELETNFPGDIGAHALRLVCAAARASRSREQVPRELAAAGRLLLYAHMAAQKIARYRAFIEEGPPFHHSEVDWLIERDDKIREWLLRNEMPFSTDFSDKVIDDAAHPQPHAERKINVCSMEGCNEPALDPVGRSVCRRHDPGA